MQRFSTPRSPLIPVTGLLAAALSYALVTGAIHLCRPGFKTAPSPASAPSRAATARPPSHGSMGGESLSLAAMLERVSRSAQDRLDLAEAVSRLPGREIQARLEEALKAEQAAAAAKDAKAYEDARSLELLLLREWTERDPTAALDWAVGGDHRELITDTAVTWASKDPDAFARELQKHYLAKGPTKEKGFKPGQNPTAFFSFKASLDIVRNQDLLLLGRVTEHAAWEYPSECGDAVGAVMKDPAELKRVTDGLRTQMPAPPPGTAEPEGMATWNSILTETARYYHRSDPTACESWIATLPESTRTKAREAVRTDDGKAH